MGLRLLKTRAQFHTFSGLYTSGCSSQDGANQQQGLLQSIRVDVATAIGHFGKLTTGIDTTTTSTISSGLPQSQLTPQLTPHQSTLDQHSFSPMSTGSLPFLSLDPPPEPDDYLFALEPYEGANELFDIYVGSSANASGNGNGTVYK